jgi:hypothetical protein
LAFLLHLPIELLILLTYSIRKLTEEKDNLEGEIGSFEAGEILKKMKNNKSPGSEFLKFFWKDLKVFVIGSLNYGYK